MLLGNDVAELQSHPLACFGDSFRSFALLLADLGYSLALRVGGFVLFKQMWASASRDAILCQDI